MISFSNLPALALLSKFFVGSRLSVLNDLQFFVSFKYFDLSELVDRFIACRCRTAVN